MGSTKGSAWTNLFAVALVRLGRLLSVRSRLLILVVALPVASIALVMFAWNKLGGQLTNHPDFLVAVDKIEVTPRPAWIHADVKADVVKSGSLEQLKINDEQVTVKVANAFQLHSWVARVKRVSKHAGSRIVVDLEYRKPVAMVEVQTNGVRGLFPIDVAGVLLPTEDFAPSEARNYLRISAGETTPAGLVGSPWGDERIVGAARLAALLESDWQTLGLYRIVVVNEVDSPRKRAEAIYELQTRKGSRIVWGRAPGPKSMGEAAASEKLVRLEQFVDEHGPLDGPDGPVQLDLRDGRPSPAVSKKP